MAVFIITCLALIVYLLYRYMVQKMSYFKELGIPHLEPTPILGNFKDSLLQKSHFSETVKKVYNVNNEALYVGAYSFMTPIIVLRDQELIKTIAIKNFDNFIDHKGMDDEKFDPIFSNNLFSMKGDRWREARNFLTPSFTSSKMRSMFDLIVPCAENLMNFVEKLSEKEKNLLDTKDMFTRFATDVIATCAFGISVDSLNERDNEFYVIGKKAASIDQGLQSLKLFLLRTFPAILKLFNLKFVSDETRKFFENVVESTIKMREEKGIERPDMIQLMMNARGKTSDNLELDLTQMTGQAFVFFLAGFDTVSNQICMICHELAINPEAQEKLQSEIDRVAEATIDQGKKLTFDVIQGMEYFDAVFNETSRKNPQGYFLDRVCTKKYQLPAALPGLKPLTVNEGDIIWIPVIGLHMNPENYENPEKFDPDRFMGKKSNSMSSLAFGIGPRNCIGNRFAIMEAKIVLFYFLRKFNVRKSIKTCDPLVYSSSSIGLKPKDGYWISIEKRS